MNKRHTLLVASALAVSLLTPAARAATIELNPTSANPTAGSTLDIEILARDVFANFGLGEALTGYAFNVAIDVPGALALTGVSVAPNNTGNFDDDSSFNGGFSASTVAAIGTGTPLTNPGAPAVTDLVLGVLSFDVLSESAATVSIIADDDPSERGLFFLTVLDPIAFSDQLTLNAPQSQTPLPATMALLTLGLLGLRRRAA